MALDRSTQALAFLVVVAKHAGDGRLEFGQHVEGFCLGDIARVNHPLDARRVEQLNDAAHVLQVVVGVADDTDAHGRLARSSAQTFSRTWIAQALPRPITCVRPMRASGT